MVIDHSYRLTEWKVCPTCVSNIFNTRDTYLKNADEAIRNWVHGLSHDSQFKWAQTYDIWISYTKCVSTGHNNYVPVFNGLSVPPQDFKHGDRTQYYIARVLKSIVDNFFDSSDGIGITPITEFRVYLTFPREPHKHRKTYNDKKNTINIFGKRYWVAELDIITIGPNIGNAIQVPSISVLIGPTLVDTGLYNMSTQELFVQCTTSVCTKACAEGGQDRKDGCDCYQFECIHQEQHRSPIAIVSAQKYRTESFKRPVGKDTRFVTWYDSTND